MVLKREDHKEQADAATAVSQHQTFSCEWGMSKSPIDLYLLGELNIREQIISKLRDHSTGNR